MSAKNISATIPAQLHERLNRAIRDAERTRSWFVSKAIESYLDEMEDAQLALSRLDDKRLTPTQLKKALNG